MPAKDTYHEHVKEALFKDGWDFQDSKVIYKLPGILIYPDFKAEKRIIEAVNQERKTKILLDVKSFTGQSFIDDLKDMQGTHNIYTYVLTQKEPDRKLWLAIPEHVYQLQFTKPHLIGLKVMYNMSIVTFNIEQRRFVQWIP
jgi:hypothetical protein